MGVFSSGATGGSTAVVPIPDNAGRQAKAQAVVVVDTAGNQVGGGVQESFILADNKSAAGDYPNNTPGSPTPKGQAVYGGDYVWTVLGTIGASSSAALKVVFRNAAGTIIGTNTLATKTAADTGGGTGIGLGSNAEVYVTLTGANLTNVSVLLSKLP